MPFPAYIHSAIASSDDSAWPVQGQGENECGVTVAANALNLLNGRRLFSKDDFVREAGLLFQRGMGGSPSPVTARLLKQHGVGTHFGNLSRTNAEAVLRDLIDRGALVGVEIGTNMVGPFAIYGQHSILLVGYSDPHPDKSGVLHEDYFFVDSQWPRLGEFDIHSNDVDADGTPTPLPGNRTIARYDFLQMYQTRIYFPIFRTQAEHDAWYRDHMRLPTSNALVSWFTGNFITGTYDSWST